ncbi:MAG TPA: hypothetical protein VG269_05250, partial [Tepidisphaeraceae bacterium]|nr:hypothetical protein [Tepidisphaeraceae bacterium]
MRVAWRRPGLGRGALAHQQHGRHRHRQPLAAAGSTTHATGIARERYTTLTASTHASSGAKQLATSRSLMNVFLQPSI